MSFRARLLALPLLAGLIFSALTLVVFIEGRNGVALLHTLKSRDLPTLRATDRALAALQRLQRGFQDAAAAQDADALAELVPVRDEALHWIDEARRATPLPEFEVLRADFVAYEEFTRETTALIIAGSGGGMDARFTELGARYRSLGEQMTARAVAAEVGMEAGLARAAEAHDAAERMSLGVGFLGLVGLFSAALLASRSLAKPLAELTHAAQRLARGDRDVRVDIASGDELTVLADAFNGMVAQLDASLGSLGAARDRAIDDGERKSSALARMRQAAGTQKTALDQTRSIFDGLAPTIRTVESSAAALAKTSSSSQTLATEMEATQLRVESAVGTLTGVVDETGAAAKDLLSAVDDITRRIRGLRAASATTTASVAALRGSTEQVDAGARAASLFAERVIVDATLGQRAVDRTRAGIDDIRSSSQTVYATLGRLTQQLGGIVGVLAAIDNINSETGILALNAQIIASQAGVHGQGFAVVADHIKALSSRTAMATREISNAVVAIEEEAGNASAAIADSERAVDDGGRLSSEASGALAQILLSADLAGEQARAITAAGQAQAQSVVDVSTAMSHVDGLLREAADATALQQRSSDRIGETTTRLRGVSADLARVSAQQLATSSALRDAVAHLAHLSEQLRQVQGAQSESAARAQQTVRQIHAAQIRTVEEIDAMAIEPTQESRESA
ncbi:MAG: methyl-accepting chemotaxis protein [Deltaproteobacteria bacterium]|nr:methyl-accepting chemotaxis protein [Deltaproteobacteria bacterium]